MARVRKVASRKVTDAAARLASLKSIDAALNLGMGLTVAIYEAAITDANAAVDAYNQTLALADQQANDVAAKEKIVQDLSVRMLSGVGVKYGYDSDEYEQAGGTRKSERKKPVKKPQIER